ncbi:MAG: serine protein kinase RIO [Candidatus Diapherotrites archaeon]
MMEKAMLGELVKEEKSREIFAKVFDNRTILALHRLADKGYFDFVEFVVSTGKEAHVFRAQDHAGNHRAVKIYKTLASDFKKMRDYIEGDLRFKEVKKDKRELVSQWARKEFKNLECLNRAGIRAPLPLTFSENILVMEFIGKEEAAPAMKEKPPKNPKKARATVAEWIALMIEKAKLVHADLSEYNILNFNEELVLIDCGQAVLTSHPKAKEFFERDVKNMANYFSKIGLKTTENEFLEQIRSFKGKP